MVGVFDDDLDTASMREHGSGPMLPSRESARALFPAYAAAPGQRQDPRFNASLADPRHMPPLFLAVAGNDVYRDSALNLARRLREAGRPVDTRIYPGMTHLFWGYGRMVDMANRCTSDMAAFLSRQLPAEAGGQPQPE